MKIKNGDVLITILPAVETLGKGGPPKLPVLTVLKVRKMLRALRQHVQDLAEIRNELLDRWGKKGEDGKLLLVGSEVQFADGDRAKFVVAQAELYAGEWNYEGPTLTLEDLGEFPFTGGLLADLGELFCDDDEAMAGKSV